MKGIALGILCSSITRIGWRNVRDDLMEMIEDDHSRDLFGKEMDAILTHCETIMGPRGDDEFYKFLSRNSEEQPRRKTELALEDRREFPWHSLSVRARRIASGIIGSTLNYKTQEKCAVFPNTYGEVLAIGRQRWKGLRQMGDLAIGEFDKIMEAAGLSEEWTFRFRWGRPSD